MKLFFKESSADEIGTACASMNPTGKSNPKKGPEKDYNAYRDFTEHFLCFAGTYFSDLDRVVFHALITFSFLFKNVQLKYRF